MTPSQRELEARAVDAGDGRQLSPAERRRLHELLDAFGLDRCVAVLDSPAAQQIADPVARLAAFLPARPPRFSGLDMAALAAPVKIQVSLSRQTVAWLETIVLQSDTYRSVEELMAAVGGHMADGAARPGSWESPWLSSVTGGSTFGDWGYPNASLPWRLPLREAHRRAGARVGAYPTGPLRVWISGRFGLREDTDLPPVWWTEAVVESIAMTGHVRGLPPPELPTIGRAVGLPPLALPEGDSPAHWLLAAAHEAVVRGHATQVVGWLVLLWEEPDIDALCAMSDEYLANLCEAVTRVQGDDGIAGLLPAFFGGPPGLEVDELLAALSAARCADEGAS